MKDYSLIHGVLGAIFASDLGRSDKEANDLFQEMLADEECRKKFGESLTVAFQDAGFSWEAAMNEYEVYPAEDEADARNYAIRILWLPVFPSKEPPSLME
jgi:hypothetical protein